MLIMIEFYYFTFSGNRQKLCTLIVNVTLDIAM